MSTTHRPAPTASSTDRPTATFPTGQWLADQASIAWAHRERLADLWEDATPTELLPVVGPAEPEPAAGLSAASATARTAFPRVSTLPEPTGGRVGVRTPSTGTKVLRRQRPHLRRALAGILIAVALLTGMQLYAAQGISSARQAALAARSEQASTAAATQPGQAPSEQPAQPDWVTEDTGAAYDRTDPHASPLDLPACTTSPDTPLPCLATISPDSRRAVVLEEDASLTALVRR